MVLYVRILQILGYFNCVICVFFTLYNDLFLARIQKNNTVSMIGTVFVTFALLVMLVLTGIFYVIVGRFTIESLIDFNVKNTIFIIIAGVNLLVRLFYLSTNGMDNNPSLTGAKLMAGIATALFLNLFIVIISTKYLK